MKVVILAGGYGTRISEESHLRPKPMVEIGDKSILWHIMKSYSAYGFNEFVICGGYKQQVIKEYFANYYLHQSDITFDFTKGSECLVNHSVAEPWMVTIVDTGLDTMTGGRVKRIQKYIDEEDFMLTYGDGVCDVNIDALLKFHKEHKKIVTITAVNPGQRFGCLNISRDGSITSFREKNVSDGEFINGGFMVMNKRIFDFLKDDKTVLGKEPLQKIAQIGELMAYKHEGFWQCMDTLRERQLLEQLWAENKAPWKVW